MIRFIIKIWKTCLTCGGDGRDKSDRNKPCPACNGAGGIDTSNI
jgi:DnaJ-class molecular chaperone